MQLYKTREFGDLFSDTFKFLGAYGKHYIVNYLIINGLLTLVLLFSMTPLLGVFFEIPSFDLKANGNFDFLFKENADLLIYCGFFVFIISLLVSAVTYSFTPVYFKLFEEKNGANFSTSELISALKEHYFKSLKGVIGLIVMSILTAIPLMIAVILTACTLVGWLIPVAMFMMLLTFTMYEYLAKKENRFFSSFGYAWDLVTFKNKFWHTTGCVAVLMILIWIVQQVFSAVIEIIFGLQTTLEISDPNDFDLGAEFWASMIVLIFISIALQLITNMISYLNLGIIFYSLKSEKENISSSNEIDSIGSAE